MKGAETSRSNITYLNTASWRDNIFHQRVMTILGSALAMSVDMSGSPELCTEMIVPNWLPWKTGTR